MNPALDVRFFDGRSSRPHAARLHVQGDLLAVAPAPGEDFAPLAVPLAQVRWPERTRHGGRIAQLPQGASVQALDVAAWDAWAAGLGAQRKLGGARAAELARRRPRLCAAGGGRRGACTSGACRGWRAA